MNIFWITVSWWKFFGPNNQLVVHYTKNIGGHVNRSGENYLIGMTPHYKYPQFPDMTHIYKTHPHKTSKTVHTVGPKRYKKAELNSKISWSEGIGLVAPVFHYFGYNIKGFGLNSANSLKQYFCWIEVVTKSYPDPTPSFVMFFCGVVNSFFYKRQQRFPNAPKTAPLQSVYQD